MFTKEFWIAALNRAIRTAAQTGIAVVGSAAIISEVNWKVWLSSIVLAAFLSVLTSIATGLPEA